jgi:hypothetical protein
LIIPPCLFYPPLSFAPLRGTSTINNNKEKKIHKKLAPARIARGLLHRKPTRKLDPVVMVGWGLLSLYLYHRDKHCAVHRLGAREVSRQKSSFFWAMAENVTPRVNGAMLHRYQGALVRVVGRVLSVCIYACQAADAACLVV